MRLPFTILTLCAALSAHAQDIRQTAQFNMGSLLPTDSVGVKLEYPRYEFLSEKEKKQLIAEGFTPEDHVVFHTLRSLSRGETVLDVSFVPVVIRNGKWTKLTDYDLRPFVYDKYNFSPVVRSIQSFTQAVSKASRYAAHSVLSTGKWVKISVSSEGIYQLTDEFLRQAGFSDPSKVKLYGYGGCLINEAFTFTGASALIDDLNEVPLYRRSGSALFYADGVVSFSSSSFTRNTFSNTGCYFLTEATDGSEPLAFSTLPQPSNTTYAITTVKAHSLVDNDKLAWYGGGRAFFDNIDLSTAHTYTLALPGNTGSQCKLFYDVSALPKGSSTTFSIIDASDSKSYVNRSIGTLGSDESARGYRGTISTTFGTEASIKVQTSNTGYLNYLHAIYEQTLSASNPKVAFTTDKTSAQQLVVSNANANTRVWELGNAQSATAELYGTLNGSTYTAETSDASKRFVIVDVAASYNAPTLVGNVDNQDLHADSAYDYVIIIPASGKYRQQAERLAAAHTQKEGMRVKVVRADQLYNEFSSGTPDASAYRRYIKMLYDKATTDADRPRFLLLFGECCYDNRMVTSGKTGTNTNDYLLAYERSDQETLTSGYGIGSLHDYVTDDYYGFLDDGEGSRITTDKVDLGIGRFICTNESDAEWLVTQAINYMDNNSVGVWKNRMWAIGDVGDNNLHMNDAQNVCSQVKLAANSGFMLRRIFPDAYEATNEAKGTTYPAATSKLKQAMKSGALIFNYNGHGSPDRLSHYFLLNKQEMGENVSSSLPLWIFASCEITPYDQGGENLGTSALFNRNGGAIGVLCASRSVYANYNASLNKGYIKYLFAHNTNNKRYSIGEALRLTKNELISTTNNTIGLDQSINKLKYALFADPALTLAYADDGLSIDSINGELLSSNSFNNLSVGDKIRFSGYVQDTADASRRDASFNGTVYATLYGPQQKITCKGHGNTTANDLTYSDYSQPLYEGTVDVKDGRFTIETIIPRGVQLSTSSALLSLYGVSADKQREFNGSFTRFCISSSSTSADTDSIGPNIYMYLNTPDFPNGATVGTSATLYAAVSDSTSISVMSGNMGHNMSLWFDNDRENQTTVNEYFTFNSGSYNEGLLEYPLSGLTLGRHTAHLQVWDAFGNSSLQQLAFVVTENAQKGFDVDATDKLASSSTRFITTIESAEVPTEVDTEVYSLSGRRVWHHSATVDAHSTYTAVDWNLTDYAGAKLDKGVYFYRSKVGSKKTSTKKMVIK